MIDRKVLRQNKLSLSVAVVLFIVFYSVIYLAGKQIYKFEQQGYAEKINGQLFSAQGSITVFFSNFKDDLFFLRDLDSTRDYSNSNFSAANYEEKVKKIFYNFGKHNERYYQIRIIDAAGQEKLKIENHQDGSTTIEPDSKLQNKKSRYYFQDTMKLNKDQIYVSPIDIDQEAEGGKTTGAFIPVIRLSTPLFNSENKRRGMLIINMYFIDVLKLLNRNMFIQTQEGNFIELNSGDAVDFKKSNFVMDDQQGELNISNQLAINYIKVNFLADKQLNIGLYNDKHLLRRALNRLIFFSLIVFTIFVFLMLIVVCAIVSRYKESVRSKKAIIYSLVRLTEFRDEETGRHLERTRNYAVVLAKELQKNEKYKNVITDEFIDDLYYAAPLHDIGKVGISDSILLKEGRLTDEEYKTMEQHVQIADKELKEVIEKYNLKESFLDMAKNICAYHHEKYNGKGYLLGLKKEKIPLEVRIFSLCDVYDALRSKRSYKEKMSHKEAAEKIQQESGKSFDPDVVAAFLKCQKEFLKISRK